MPMRRGAALLLLAASAGVASAGILCADPDDFDGSATINGPDDTCQNVVDAYFSAYVGLDSVTAAQCNETLVHGGGPGGRDLALRDALKYMIYCCGGQPTADACGPLFPEDQNPCADPADLDPFAELGDGHCSGDEDITDQQACEAAGYPEAWDPAAEEKCDVGRIDAGASVQQAACTSLGGSWEMTTCFMNLMNLQDVTFSASTCNVRHPHFGDASTAMVLSHFGGSCCGSRENRKTVCDPFPDGRLPNPCDNPAMFNPSALLDPDSPSMTCADFITYAFQGHYNATSPPVLCNFTAAECARDLSETFNSDGELDVEMFLQFSGQRCCGGGAPTRACTPMQGTMPCASKNTSSPHNVTCHDIKAFHREHHCCRNASRTCAEVKRHYREHACCGMPTKYVPAPSFMGR